jgi:hypothetical protein
VNTQERLLDACQKLLALAVAPELFEEERRNAILKEARTAIASASAERN